MKRLAHGAALLDDNPAVPEDAAAPPPLDNLVRCPQQTRFGYLFPQLRDASCLLLEAPDTAQTLIDLGNTMSDTDPESAEGNSTIPSVYSYFGQFITHEIVFEITSTRIKLGPDTVPMDEADTANLKSARTALLDLDSVYGPIVGDPGRCYAVPNNKDELVVDRAGNSDVDGTDLPREPKPPFTARIGERRNDANLITSQMHLAFLRAHNALVDSGRPFNVARGLLRQHFQSLIVSDYLPRVVNADVRQAIQNGRLDVFSPPDNPPFMPIEFSAAVFRFGHSMPRHRYDYNDSYDDVRLSSLFLPKTGGYHHMLQEWIIDWSRFIDGGTNRARRLDTRLVDPLSRLINEKGEPVQLVDKQEKPIVDPNQVPVRTSLAALDLLRGYLLRVPTGQAVAGALNLPIMSATDIENVAANDEQKALLIKSGLSSRTPLWFYVLAEAAHFEQGMCLGPVGSTIVAKVLIGLVRRSTDSILREPNWVPTLGNAGHFDLAELFRLAGVLSN